MAKTCKGVVIMRKGIDESKVQRMRNLVSGKYGEKTKIRSGFSSKRIVREEGDVWEERGKTWTIKNGLKQTINKLDKIRLENATPLCCPQCGGNMKHSYHKYAWKFFKFCGSCLATFETKLKATGKWKDYREDVQQKNFDSWIREMTEQFLDFKNSRNSNNTITEAGDIETWEGGQTDEELKQHFDKKIKDLIEMRNGKNK